MLVEEQSPANNHGGSRMVKTGRMGPSASSYDGSEKLPVGVCAGSICADELEENACLRHGIR
jgi:hypothetical protein